MKIFVTPEGKANPILAVSGLIILVAAGVFFYMMSLQIPTSGPGIAFGLAGTACVWVGGFLLVFGIRKPKPDYENSFALLPSGKVYHVKANIDQLNSLPVGLVGFIKFQKQSGEIIAQQEQAEEKVLAEEFVEYVQSVIQNPDAFDGFMEVIPMDAPMKIKTSKENDVYLYTHGKHAIPGKATLWRRNTGYEELSKALSGWAASAGLK